MNQIYEIKIAGDLDARWSQWFGGLEVSTKTEGETLIRGPVRDQTELYGILNKLRDLGLTLISVRRIENNG